MSPREQIRECRRAGAKWLSLWRGVTNLPRGWRSLEASFALGMARAQYTQAARIARQSKA